MQNLQWSPKLAYAVGLLTTDGNLSNDGRHIIFRSCDMEQIRNFKRCLKLSNKICAPKPNGQFSKKTCYRIQLGDIHFYNWLLKIGLFPAKSYTIGPLQIPDAFLRDFIRGHLDGDGTIVVYQDRYNTVQNPAYAYLRIFVRFISASRSHIEWLRKRIKKVLGISGDLFEVVPTGKIQKVSVWHLKYMKKESMRLLQWIYYDQNIPCLTRKRQKAEKALTIITKTKRKSYTKKNRQP